MSKRAATEAPRPSDAHRRLAVFLGDWILDGKSRPSPYDKHMPAGHGDMVQTTGRCHDEWLAGEFFLVHRWDQRNGSVPFRGMWVVGVDGDGYAMRLYDDGGHAVDYRLAVDGDVWTITGREQRATIDFTDGGNRQRQRWWMKDGEGWLPLCDLTATRA